MGMGRKRPTVAELKAQKGKGQLTMLRYFTLEEAAAAEAAGIDIASVPPELVTDPQYRRAAPSVFSMTGKTCGFDESDLLLSPQALASRRGARSKRGSCSQCARQEHHFAPVLGARRGRALERWSAVGTRVGPRCAPPDVRRPSNRPT